MRLSQLQNSYLYEGLDYSQSKSVALWESAGFKLKEAALTADQIQQIFADVEAGATAGGNNRTVLGKGKDAASAVNKAWEDLKTKVQDSAPIKNVDSMYDNAVAKIEAGLGGPDNAVNQVIQKYRKFAKEHPIAQGLIYSALIAAAGISGAGLGGAAVLGLLKMTDKLLQGEKFSSAAYSGAKTGAMAYGASKIGDLVKGQKPDAEVPTTGPAPTTGQVKLPDADSIENARATAAASGEVVKATSGNLAQMDGLSPIQAKVAAIIDSGKPLTQNQMDFLYKASANAAQKASMLGDMPDGTANAGLKQFMALDVLLRNAKVESIQRNSKTLSEGQVYMIINRVTNLNESLLTSGILVEGPMDTLKGIAGKALGKAKTIGTNLTTKVTADKLNKAWQKAGSPMDSAELSKFLTAQGVDQGVVDKVYTDLKLPTSTQTGDEDGKIEPTMDPAKAKSSYASIKELVLKLDKKGKQRIAAYLQKQLGTA